MSELCGTQSAGGKSAVAGSQVLPTQNPAFNLLKHRFIWLAGRTLADAHLEHSKKADDCIEGVIPFGKSVTYIFPEAFLKLDAVGISPAKQGSSKLFPVVLAPLAAKRFFAEPCPFGKPA